MIYTVTLNPAIDYKLNAESFSEGAINRSLFETVSYGGKGINVSVILARMGIPTVAIGFAGGFTGNALKEYLKAENVIPKFVDITKGITRINVKIKNNGTETAINGAGPEITDTEFETLLSYMDNITCTDVVVLAGSVPAGLPKDVYKFILDKVNRKGAYTVVDSTGRSVTEVLSYRPFLIKPNQEELEEMVGFKIQTIPEIIRGCKVLQDMGAQNVLVSRGKDGAVLVTASEGNYAILSPAGVECNTVGAGDSMVAGFVGEYCSSGDFIEALKAGTACGAATAFSTTLATYEEIEKTKGMTASPILVE